jgi:hypothetical protein
MGSVAEEGCVILVRDVCEMLADSTGGMSFAAHLAAYGRCLEHDAANALEPGLSSLRPDVSAAAPIRKHAAVLGAPTTRRRCAVCVQRRKAPRSTLLGRHNGRRRPRHVYEMIAFSAMAHLEPQRCSSPRAGAPTGMRGRRTRPVPRDLHTEEELVEIFACRRPR